MSKSISVTPQISVIIPVYNGEDFIWEAIMSILSQSFREFECIIVDDASTDQSYQICQEYAKKDQRIRLYKNDENKWISFTRNRLINLCVTNYIASQDCDDISVINRLELCFNFLEQNKDYGVVSWNNTIIDEGWSIIGKRVYPSNIWKSILKKSPISQPSSMFRKDIFLKLGWYDQSLNYWEDYDLWLKMYSYGYKIYNLDEVILCYRIHNQQTKSKQLKQTLKNTIFIQKRAMMVYGVKPVFSDYIYLFMEKCLLYLPNKFVLFLFKKLEYRT